MEWSPHLPPSVTDKGLYLELGKTHGTLNSGVSSSKSQHAQHLRLALWDTPGEAQRKLTKRNSDGLYNLSCRMLEGDVAPRLLDVLFWVSSKTTFRGCAIHAHRRAWNPRLQGPRFTNWTPLLHSLQHYQYVVGGGEMIFFFIISSPCLNGIPGYRDTTNIHKSCIPPSCPTNCQLQPCRCPTF